MDETKLTNEQRQLVQDNLGLAYKFAESYRWSPHRLDHEEVVQQALLGLCHAAKKYNPDRGKFSPFAWRQMQIDMKKLVVGTDALSLYHRVRGKTETRAYNSVSCKGVFDELASYNPRDFSEDLES